MAANVGDGPVKSTLDHVVEKLAAMNKDQTDLQKEAVLYSNELQDYVQNEGHNMSNAQLVSMNELILALREGRLDDIEASKEELIRRRAEEKRDETRNDHLKDVFKQLKKQFKFLKKVFDKDKGITLMGLVVRTALVGFIMGVWQGFTRPYIDGLKKLGLGIRSLSSNVFRFFGFDKLFTNMKNGFNNFTARFLNFFKNNKFFKNTKNSGLIGMVFTETKNIFKDLFAIVKGTFLNVTRLLRGFVGLFTLAPLAFQPLTEFQTKIKPVSKTMKMLGNAITFLLTPFRKLGGLMRGGADKLYAMIDKLGGIIGGENSRLANFGTAVKEFFQRSPAMVRFFEFFSTIQKVLLGVGKVVGRLLWPLFAIIGAFKGFRENYGIEEDGFNNMIKTMHGMVKGAFRMLFGDLFDLILIDFLGWIVGFFSTSAKEKMHTFSFADWFDDMFDAMTEFIIETIDILRDQIADIGIKGILKNMMLELGDQLRKIALFPAAIVAAGGAALGAALNPFSERSGKEAFAETYASMMNIGKARIDAMRVTADGLDADGKKIDALSDLYTEGEAYKTFNAINRDIMNPTNRGNNNPIVDASTTQQYAQQIIGTGLDPDDILTHSRLLGITTQIDF